METWRLKYDDGKYWFNFGMYKDMSVSTTPDDYLTWIVNNFEDEDLVEICQAELDRRVDEGKFIE